MKQQIVRYRRFKGWDYTKGASFFITIATAPKRPLFGAKASVYMSSIDWSRTELRRVQN